MAGKGNPKTGGRQKGSVNKLTKTFKQAVLTAYEGIGGDQNFTEWARNNQTEYYKIASKLIPTEVSTDPDNPPTMVFRWQSEKS